MSTEVIIAGGGVLSTELLHSTCLSQPMTHRNNEQGSLGLAVVDDESERVPLLVFVGKVQNEVKTVVGELRIATSLPSGALIC